MKPPESTRASARVAPAPAGRLELVERVRGHHVALGVLAALAVVAGLVLGIGKVAGFARLGDAFGDADPRWLAICVAAQAAVFAGYSGSLRAAVAAEDGPRLPAGPAVRLVFASFAATQLLAFGGVGGLALVYWALRRIGLARPAALERLIGVNTAVYLTFGTIAWIGAWWALAAAQAPLWLTAPWLIVLPVVLLAARWFTQPDRVERWDPSTKAGWRRPLGVGVGAAAWVRRRVAARDRRLFGWSAAYWVGDIVSLWAALHAVGARPGVAALVVAYTTGYLAQSVPIPFIATGGVDAATTFLLHAVGVPLELALAGVLAHRLFAFWLPVIPGSVFALTLPRLGRTLSATSPRSAA